MHGICPPDTVCSLHTTSPQRVTAIDTPRHRHRRTIPCPPPCTTNGGYTCRLNDLGASGRMFEISYFHKLWGINPHLFDQRLRTMCVHLSPVHNVAEVRLSQIRRDNGDSRTFLRQCGQAFRFWTFCGVSFSLCYFLFHFVGLLGFIDFLNVPCCHDVARVVRSPQPSHLCTIFIININIIRSPSSVGKNAQRCSM